MISYSIKIREKPMIELVWKVFRVAVEVVVAWMTSSLKCLEEQAEAVDKSKKQE